MGQSPGESGDARSEVCACSVPDAAVATAANLAVRLARKLQRELRPSLVERIERRYAQVVVDALANHEAQLPLAAPQPKRRGRQKHGPMHNLALRLRNCQDSVLRFLHEPAILFTHNQAEQDVRMMKVRQKISGAFLLEQGAQDFATLRSVLSSVQEQGRNHLEALLQGPSAGILGQLREYR